MSVHELFCIIPLFSVLFFCQIKYEAEDTSLRDLYEPIIEDATVKDEPVESEEEDKLVINEPMKDEPPEEDEEEMPLVSKKEPKELPEDDDEDDMPLVSVFVLFGHRRGRSSALQDSQKYLRSSLFCKMAMGCLA